MHTYDPYGWYAADQYPDRQAPEPPTLSTTDVFGLPRANWTGYEWRVVPYQPPPGPVVAEPTLDELKAARAELVAAIVVTTVAGNTFDGDEDSQNRMARAIAGMDDTDETMWVLANNALIMVGKVELREALRLAGIAMTTIWMAPYQ